MDATARAPTTIAIDYFAEKTVLGPPQHAARINKNVLLYENDNNDVVAVPRREQRASSAGQPVFRAAHIRLTIGVDEHKCRVRLTPDSRYL